MTDTTYILLAVRGCESEPAVVAAIENLNNGEQIFEVLETVIDDGGTPDEPVIHFPT